MYSVTRPGRRRIANKVTRMELTSTVMPTKTTAVQNLGAMTMRSFLIALL